MARILHPAGCVPDKFADFFDKHVMRLGYSEERVRDKECVLVSCLGHATIGAFAHHAEQWFN